MHGFFPVLRCECLGCGSCNGQVSCPGRSLASCPMLSPSRCILNAWCKSVHAFAETSGQYVHSEGCPHQGELMGNFLFIWSLTDGPNDSAAHLHKGALKCSCSTPVSGLLHSWISLTCVLPRLLFTLPCFWILSIAVTKIKCYDTVRISMVIILTVKISSWSRFRSTRNSTYICH